jgi:hypothetical protein
MSGPSAQQESESCSSNEFDSGRQGAVSLEFVAAGISSTSRMMLAHVDQLFLLNSSLYIQIKWVSKLGATQA